jgi:hypothetical protein
LGGWEPEGGDGVLDLELGRYLELIEDVSFVVLNEKDDAEGKGGGGSRGAVGSMSGGEPPAKSLDCTVWWRDAL